MDSLISRQAAIEALNECRERTERSEEFAGLKIAVGVMRALPSAQPDTKAQLSGEGTTSDYISRQAAIDALNECRERTERSEEFAGLKIAVGVMRALPSAQPELYNNSTKLDSGNGECRATNKPKMGQYCIDHNCPWYDGKKCNSPNDPGYHECDYDRGIFPESYEENVKNSTESSLTQKPLDTIDRQAAIDALLAVTGNSSVRELYEHVQEHGLSDMWSGGVNAAIDVIIAQPSAQPELIYCKDCSYYDGRPCGIVDWYNTADDYCSRAERREDEQTD